MLGFHEPACIFFWLFSWYMSTFLYDTDSRTSFKKSTRPTGNQSMRPQEYGEWLTVFHLRWWFVLAAFVLSITRMVELEGMNTDSLMIWLLMLLRVKEVMYGHAKTMMEMCRVISWPKVCGTDHWHHEDSASKTFVVCLSYSGCNIYNSSLWPLVLGRKFSTDIWLSFYRFRISWLDDLCIGMISDKLSCNIF